MNTELVKARFIFWMTRMTFRLYWFLFSRLEVHGLRHIPERSSCLLVANHRSMLDGFLVYSLMDRKIYSLIKSDYFRNPISSWYLNGAGGIPIKKGECRPSSIRRVKTALRTGSIVLIFPEGQVNEGNDLLPFENSFAKLAIRHGIPIIPVALIGTEMFFPNGKWLPRFSKVRVIINEPIVLDPATSDNLVEDSVQRVKSVISAALTSGCESRVGASKHRPQELRPVQP